MSLRTKVVASIAFATSAFLLAPAAQAATHPVQVSGAKLKSALLPASAFGSGFKLIGATSSGKSLWDSKATAHVPTMSCVNQAFKLTQSVSDAAPVGVSLDLNTLVTVAGADVFVVINFTTSNHQEGFRGMGCTTTACGAL